MISSIIQLLLYESIQWEYKPVYHRPLMSLYRLQLPDQFEAHIVKL